MAAFVEFESRFARDRRAAGKQAAARADLSRRTQPAALMQARELMDEVARDYPGTPHAQIALQHEVAHRDASARTCASSIR